MCFLRRERRSESSVNIPVAVQLTLLRIYECPFDRVLGAARSFVRSHLQGNMSALVARS